MTVGPKRASLWLGVMMGLVACTGDVGSDDDGSGGSFFATGPGAGAGTTTGGGAGVTTGQGAGTTAGSGGMGAGTTTGAGAGGCDAGPLPEPIPNCQPTPLPSSGDFHQDCVDRINQFRWECQCLPPLARWAEQEGCSDAQAANDQASNSPHGNFGSCTENAQNTCPNWGSEQQVIGGCLQMMWDEGPGEPFSEHGHYLNMSSTSYSKVACGIS
ncbi:MAG TPA: hypothetical protein ENK57_15940, partial [Polyangiaceae bacterium]|nr:hypothetical protein [Polyangiaceae bacterium]